MTTNQTKKNLNENGSELRLSKLLDYLQLSANKFSQEIGLKRAQGIYDILDGKNNISPSMARRIVEKYKNINYKWLVSGIDEMLIKNTHSSPNNGTIGTLSSVNVVGNIDLNNVTEVLELSKSYHDMLDKKDEQMSEKDRQISEKDKQLSERDAQINRLLSLVENLTKKIKNVK
jgi:plasmid maintenance system antidote protein VapI